MRKTSIEPKSKRGLLGDQQSLRIAYRELLEALPPTETRKGAASLGLVPWPNLREKGVSESAILVMLYQAHVEVFEMPSGPRARRGVPAKIETAIIHDSLLLALTDEGSEFARKIYWAPRAKENEHLAPYLKLMRRTRLKPRYGRESRTLYWGRHVLKRFKEPAPNQELLLQAAEEHGWAKTWMDDPLLHVDHPNPKTRLHDTIKRLNRNQRPYLIHFKGDGTGRRFGWEFR